MPGPMRLLVRRALLWGVGASVILPIVLGVVVGLGALLQALGDSGGALACGRFALVVAVAWLVAVIGTSLAAALAALEREKRPRRRRHPIRRRWRDGAGRHRHGPRSQGGWSDSPRQPRPPSAATPPPPGAGPG